MNIDISCKLLYSHYMKKKSRTRSIVTHKGFIAISMFSLGLLLPFTFPSAHSFPTQTDLKERMTFPSIPEENCKTVKTENGITRQCNYQYQNSQILSSPVLKEKMWIFR